MKNKKFILLSIGILLGMSALVGISYAYYIKSHNQEESNVVKTKCLNFSLTNEKNDINLDKQYPIQDTEGRKLTPYQFTITNTCEQFISYNVNLESLEATTMDSGAVKVMINNEAPVNLSTLESTSVSIDTSKDSKILATGSLGSNDSVDYTLRLWMDYGTTADTSSMNKVFESKIVVTATVGTYKPSDYVTTLHDAILVNEYGVTDVNNAVSKIEAKETPDLSKTAPTIKWKKTESKQITNNVEKLSQSSIKSDSQTSDLNSEEYKMHICTSKTFDDSSAKYKLSNCSLLDPTALNYDNNTDYYYSIEYISFSQSNQKIYTDYVDYGQTIYKIVGAVKKKGSETINNVNYDTIIYDLSVIPLSSIEEESDKSDKGLYKAIDDYGTTFYFRGNVSNNNVYFGGFYWKIIRINGNGSIRLLYNGLKSTSSGINQSINNQRYQFNCSNDKPTYVGYMYGNANGTTYDEVHNNTNSSAIKNTVDSWYKTNMVDKGYENYIQQDTGFCGDRNLASNSTGDGIQTDKISFFGSYERFENQNVQFICPNKERDLYTIGSSNIGNKALNYPIGLITLDELIYAGMKEGYINKLSWVYSDTNYWTMSPSYYQPSYAISNVFFIQKDGFPSGGLTVTNNFNVRPVINLKSDVEITGGIGTVNDPYIVKTT